MSSSGTALRDHDCRLSSKSHDDESKNISKAEATEDSENSEEEIQPPKKPDEEEMSGFSELSEINQDNLNQTFGSDDAGSETTEDLIRYTRNRQQELKQQELKEAKKRLEKIEQDMESTKKQMEQEQPKRDRGRPRKTTYILEKPIVTPINQK